MRGNLDSAGLHVAAAGTRDVRQARRLLALAMVLDGHPRHLAAKTGGMDRQGTVNLLDGGRAGGR